MHDPNSERRWLAGDIFLEAKERITSALAPFIAPQPFAEAVWLVQKQMARFDAVSEACKQIRAFFYSVRTLDLIAGCIDPSVPDFF